MPRVQFIVNAGFSKGTNRRTGSMGLVYSYKTEDVIADAEMADYSDIDKLPAPPNMIHIHV